MRARTPKTSWLSTIWVTAKWSDVSTGTECSPKRRASCERHYGSSPTASTSSRWSTWMVNWSTASVCVTTRRPSKTSWTACSARTSTWGDTISWGHLSAIPSTWCTRAKWTWTQPGTCPTWNSRSSATFPAIWWGNCRWRRCGHNATHCTSRSKSLWCSSNMTKVSHGKCILGMVSRCAGKLKNQQNSLGMGEKIYLSGWGTGWSKRYDP